MTDSSSKIIKGYQLLDELGAGGFGAVYRAHQTLLKRDVAIKVILPEHANKPNFVRRFETEAELVARLEHPHIVPIYDFWRDPNGAYIIMRYIKGVNLREKLATNPLSEAEASHILEQIATALHFAHRHMVVHRDLKPENILIDEDGNAYLLDFGIAKDLSRTHDPDSQGGGTLMYASPEQLTGDPITSQADMYSLGLLVYEMLTDNLPHERTTPHAIKQLQFNEDLPDIDGISDPILEVLRRATHAQPEERFATAVEFASAFRDAIRTTSSSTPIPIIQPIDDEFVELTNPYKGLMAFQEYDSHNFYGRDTLVDRLVERLDTDDDSSGRFLAVVGPSGSGKSSVVKAGLLPRIRKGNVGGSENWFVVEMYPGTNPFFELEAALLRVAVNPPESLLAQLQENSGLQRAIKRVLPVDETVELLLIIDQFEELFTLVQDESLRLHFINSLLDTIEDERGRLRVVVTLRADFYDKPLQYREFGEMLDKRKVTVFPLSRDELSNAIVKPAEQVGAVLQSGLLEAIISDVSDQPGMLPLLQYTLAQLFDNRQGRTLTLDAYRQLGGVTGALAQQADDIFEQLSSTQQHSTRQLFLRLVTLGEGTEDTRRRVQQTELEAIPEIAVTLDRFGQARLLTFDRDPATRVPTVEVAHEALIRSWDRFKDWVNDSRDELRIQRNLTTTTSEWLDSDRDPGFLARDARLEQFVAWADHTDLALSGDEQAFLAQSLQTREEREQAEVARKAREAEIAQRAQNFQRASIGLSVISVFAILATLVAGIVGMNTSEARSTAIAQANAATIAQGQAIAAQQTAIEREVAANIRVTDSIIQQSTSAQFANVVSTQVSDANIANTQSAQLRLDAQNFADSVLLALRAKDVHSSGYRSLALSLALEASFVDNPPRTERILSELAYQPAAIHVLKGHSGLVNRVTFSPDSTRLLSASESTLILWDVETGKILRHFDDIVNSIASIAFSPNGSLVLVGAFDNSLILLDVETGQSLHRFDGHSDAIWSIVFSPDGRQFASGSTDTSIILWDLNSRELLKRYNIPNGGVRSMAFSPDGTQLLVGSKQGLNLLDIETGEILNAYGDRFQGDYNYVAFSPNGSQVFSGSANGGGQGPRLWDKDTGDIVQRFSGLGLVISAVISPDGSQIFMAGLSKNLTVSDTESGEILRDLKGHTDNIWSLAISPDGRYAASGDQDNIVILWDIQPGEVLQRLEGRLGSVYSVAFSPDGKQVVSGSNNDTVILWDTETGDILRRFDGHTDAVLSVAFSPDGSTIASGSSDGILIAWDTETGDILRRFDGHTDAVLSVAFSPGGSIIASGSRNHELLLWDIETGNVLRRLEGHGDNLHDLVFSPNGGQILTGSDNNLLIWDVASTSALQRLEGHTDSVQSVAYSPDGQKALSGSGDGTLILWDIETESIVQRFDGHIGGIESVAISPDGKRVLSGSNDDTVILWDIETGNILRHFRGHSHWVKAVEFSPDGSQLISASRDGTIILWRNDSITQLQSWVTKNRILPVLSCEQRLSYGMWHLCEANNVIPPSPTLLSTNSPITPVLASTLTPTWTPVVAERIAVLGENHGETLIGGGQIWEYNGSIGEILNIYVEAQNPAHLEDYSSRVPTGFDPVLIVHSPSGRVWINDDIEASSVTNSQIQNLELTENGVYEIEVRSWMNESSGAYTMILERIVFAAPNVATITSTTTSNVPAR